MEQTLAKMLAARQAQRDMLARREVQQALDLSPLIFGMDMGCGDPDPVDIQRSPEEATSVFRQRYTRWSDSYVSPLQFDELRIESWRALTDADHRPDQ